MKINWKVRLKNPYFYITLLVVVASQIGVNLGINMDDVTTWQMVGDIIMKTVSNPSMLVSVAVALFAFLVDPTTVGLGDSKQALTYEKPNGDK